MAVRILDVPRGTIGYRAGIRPGETLVSINGHEIMDILDYRFFETECALTLAIQDTIGLLKEVTIKKGRYASLGLVFETYLMDQQRSCRNQCIFCFIDQLPEGLRESLYFKDDDARLSFLFGNYITLTNLSRQEIDRMIAMKISPINISVHTTNPALRVRMMGNRFAGDVLSVMAELAENGIQMNCQLVLCPGINDGDELVRTLNDLLKYYPAVQSIAVVPVGLTDHRKGLVPLQPYTDESAGQVIDIVEDFAREQSEKTGQRLAFCADEFYIKAKRTLPEADYYEDFSQLENGVGLIALLREEFASAMKASKQTIGRRHVSLATGAAAAPFLRAMLDEAVKRWHNLTYSIYPVVNHFFGNMITVAGLVTGGDLLAQLKDKELGDELLIPAVMLRQGEDVFLDDMALDALSGALNIKIRVVGNDGQALLNAVLGVK